MYTNYYPSSRLFHGAAPLVMGTRLDALLLGDDPAALDALWRRMVAEVRRMERMLSRFDPEGALFGVNRDAAFYPANMPEELWEVLQDCRRYFTLTEGCFDITRGCFDRVEFDGSRRTVFLNGRANLDLGGCGKGYALRQIRRLLKAEGIQQALVNFGDSSVLAVGTHPHGDCWPAGIRHPYTGEQAGVLRLRDSALSVSGNRPSRPEHIVQPATGDYVRGRKCVAAVADDPVDAEALTTALMAATGKQAADMIQKFNVKEYQIYE